MVGTRQKGKLLRISHGMKIDLTKEGTYPPAKRSLEIGAPSGKKSSAGKDSPREDADLFLGLMAGKARENESEEEEAHSKEPEYESEEDHEEGSDEPKEPEKLEEKEEESEEEERPVKRARTPTTPRRVRTPVQAAKGKWSETNSKPGTGKRGIVVPSRIDFDALRELGVKKEVREKFASIGWEKFLDFDTAVYTELVREFFEELQIVTKGEEVSYIRFRLGEKVEELSPNQINSKLGVTTLIEMVTPEFHQAVTSSFQTKSQ